MKDVKIGQAIRVARGRGELEDEGQLEGPGIGIGIGTRRCEKRQREANRIVDIKSK